MFSGLTSFFLRRTLITATNTGNAAVGTSLSRAASSLAYGNEECVVLREVDVLDGVESVPYNGSGGVGRKYTMPLPLQSAISENVNALGQVPSHEEIVSVLDTLFDQPERLLKLLSPKQLQTLRNNTHQVAAEIGLLYETSATPQPACDLNSSNCISKVTAESEASWEELASRHSCVVCMDVLAAPVITNCGHSYCGECLSSHIEACTSNDVEVVHPCPTCRAEITSVTYERGYDASIEASVARAATCTAKDEYYERRQEYLIRRREEAGAVEEGWDEAGLMFALGLSVAVLAFIVIEVVRTCRRR